MCVCVVLGVKSRKLSQEKRDVGPPRAGKGLQRRFKEAVGKQNNSIDRKFGAIKSNVLTYMINVKTSHYKLHSLNISEFWPKGFTCSAVKTLRVSIT